jgi:hypothetical protein
MGFEGTWELTVDSPMGAKAFRIEVRREGDALQGTASMSGDTTPMEGLVEENGHLKWTVRITRPMNIALAFDVTLAGDALEGTAKAGFMTLPGVKGVRV